MAEDASERATVNSQISLLGASIFILAAAAKFVWPSDSILGGRVFAATQISLAALVVLFRSRFSTVLFVYTAFAVFVLWDIGRWVLGYQSCGCLGRIEIHPLLSAVMSLAFLVTLICARSSIVALKPRTVITALAATVLLLLIYINSGSGKGVEKNVIAERLVASVFRGLSQPPPAADISVINLECQSCQRHLRQMLSVDPAAGDGNVQLLIIAGGQLDITTSLRLKARHIGVQNWPLAEPPPCLPMIVAFREGVVMNVQCSSPTF